MTSRLIGFIRAVRIPLVVCILSLISPAPAALQEQAPGTIAVPAAGSEQQPSADAGTLATSAPGETMEQPGTYTIVQGDTLWDIANVHYRDPFLWPLIWKSNPFIENPDLIYPGNTLVIPSLAPIERAMREPEQQKAPPAPVVEAAPPPASEGVPSFFRQKRVESLAAPTEPEMVSKMVTPEDTRPTLLDKYGILSGGFVSDEPSQDVIVTHTIDQGKSIFGYDDVVYISVKSRQDVKVGDLFLIYKPDHDVRHPVTGRSFGNLNRVMGILKVTEAREQGPHVARIARSFSEAAPGSLITPYQQPEPLYATGEQRQKDISGYVLEVTDRRSINAQADIVYLDKGKIDGVEPGDEFLVISEEYVDMRRIEKSGKMPLQVGEAQVFLVKDRTATAIVKKSTNVISRGNRVQYKN